MALDNVFTDLMRGEDITTEKILSELLNDKNINLKTHIITPIELSILEGYIEYLEELQIFAKKHGLKKTARFLNTFLKRFKQFMVSWQRLSRKEITETLAGIREQQTAKSLTSRLLGMGGKSE